jgi:hypothetical protein
MAALNAAHDAAHMEAPLNSLAKHIVEMAKRANVIDCVLSKAPEPKTLKISIFRRRKFYGEETCAFGGWCFGRKLAKTAAHPW